MLARSLALASVLVVGACARLIGHDDRRAPEDLRHETRAADVLRDLAAERPHDLAGDHARPGDGPRDQPAVVDQRILERRPPDLKPAGEKALLDLKAPVDHGKPALDLKPPLVDLKPPLDLKPDTGPACAPPCVVTIAGSGVYGILDGPALQAQLYEPTAVAISGGELLIADTYNHGVRRLAGGVVSTLLASAKGGFADGPLSTALLKEPRSVALDAMGGLVIADAINNRVRRIAGGSVTTLAGDGTQGWLDGPALQARLYQPEGVAIDGTGAIYIADTRNHRIRVLSLGSVSTLAGNGAFALVDGASSAASFYQPTGLALAAGKLYVADRLNHAIRVVTSGTVTTLAGGIKGYLDGPLASARFDQPSGVAVDSAGTIYVADTLNHRIRVIAGGKVTTLAGSTQGLVDGPAATAKLYRPVGLLLVAGSLLIADSYNHVIRRLSF